VLHLVGQLLIQISDARNHKHKTPHLRLGFPNILFPSDFPNKTRYKQTDYVIPLCDFTLSHITSHLFGVWHYIIIF